VTLVLFSSNIRPQYEQDVIDVLAAPKGQIFRFRYSERIVDDSIREKWAQNNLKDEDSELLVVYSIQQPERYHKPAYIPVRRANILRTERQGSIYVVQFELGAYASLPLGRDFGAEVQAYTSALDSKLNGSPAADDEPKRFSAALGTASDIVPNNLQGDQRCFEATTEYLRRTVSFSSTYFWRVSSIEGPTAGKVVLANPPGVWRLISERSYEVRVTQFQSQAMAGIGSFDVDTDTSLLQVVGDTSFSIASKYDEIPIYLRVPLLSDTRDTMLTIRPRQGTSGPSANIRFRVGPQRGSRALTGAAGAGAAVLASVPAFFTGDLRYLAVPASAALLYAVGYRGVPMRTTSA
jgi:hypothetical protein